MHRQQPWPSGQTRVPVGTLALPTFIAAAGDPGSKEKLFEGMKVGNCLEKHLKLSIEL